MSKVGKETPMMQQYWEFRRKLPADTILLFRLGDFYELFHADAEEGARLLGITLTQRQSYPMAGIPYHAADTYIPRLLAAGKKVAICEQVETPRPGKLVKRALTRILTAGTTLDEKQLDPSSNHYIVAIHLDSNGFHTSWMDLSTGSYTIATAADPEELTPVLHALQPKECVLAESTAEKWSRYADAPWYESLQAIFETSTLTHIPDYHYDTAAALQPITTTLGVLNLDGFGIQADHPALGTAAALLHYVSETLCSQPRNLSRLQVYRPSQYLQLDPSTQRNLEIFRSAHGHRKGSLLAAVDATRTAPGARLLEHYLATPPLDLEEIRRRQRAVGALVALPNAAARIQEHLKKVRDITRILGRLQNRIRNPRELGAIRATLDQLPDIRHELLHTESSQLLQLGENIDPLPELTKLLNQALNDELPSAIQDGNCIRNGFDDELDRLRSLNSDNRSWISDLEAKEQEATGIRNLRIKYTSSFGYFIEVTKSNLHLVPEHYHRRQTMTNVERYTTDALREKESEILTAEEKSLAREEQLFQQLVQSILQHASSLHKTAMALAEVDLFCGWAELAREWDYCEPVVDDSELLLIEEGRHPVVEQMLHQQKMTTVGNHAFVPNDTHLDASEEQIALITGPNMAGKSTYIRQIALIALLAQTGCWVPARSCRIGWIDRIFSRVGASDELSKGNSTFMVEMNETANILNNATPRSLIILDEIGRGTSTYDGLSIAWSVVEHLHGPGERGPRTLFATHYHEITRLEESLPRLRNYSVSVKEWDDEIIFVRQIQRGAADRSYGIQVARLAGLPSAVIHRARQILQELESEGAVLSEHLKKEQPPVARPRAPKPRAQQSSGQLELF